LGPLGPHLDDERLSALLDGLAEPSDAAHADGCPDCTARLAGWSQARRLVAAAPAVAPETRREAAIQAALATFDASGDRSGSGPIDLAAARRRRLGGLGSGRGAAAAAAAIVMVAGLAFGLSRIGHDHTVKSAGPTAASPSATSKAATPRSAGAGSASQANRSAASTERFGTDLMSLGSFPDMSKLIPALRSKTAATLVPGAPFSNATPLTSTRCADAFAAAGVAATTSPDLEAALVYARTQAVVFVFATPHAHTVVVVNGSTCAILARGAF